MHFETSFYSRTILLWALAMLPSTHFGNCPNNYICADAKGKVVYFCAEGKTGPWSCCQKQQLPSECPEGFEIGPFKFGSVEYTNYDLRQFQQVADNNTMNQSDYRGWMEEHPVDIPMEALLDDFNDVDTNGDGKISLQEFIASRKATIAQVESTSIPSIYLLLLCFILVVFFSIAMKIFSKKLGTL